jgi:ADP-heptose:LPS heptosyltransferase
LFGVHPGNGASAFNWPLARYVELINRLAMHGRVLVTGGPSERAMLATIQSRLSRAIESRVRCFTDFDLNELAAALSSLTCLTASSTGPMHMAGILETAVVALFSPHPVHSPAKWAPLGSKHTIFIAPLQAGENSRVPRERGEEIMGRISVDDVLAANLRYAATLPTQGLARAS